MLSSDIGQAHCVTVRYWQDIIPTEDYREAARRALRRRSEPKRQPTKAVERRLSRAKRTSVLKRKQGRVWAFKPAGAQRLKEMERVKGIEPSS
jgi:hypothetical protein